MIASRFALGVAAAMAMLVAAPMPARAGLKLADSFRIGSGGVLCTAQNRVAEPALASMFDRGYRITCRDAAAPVGKLFALRLGGRSATEAAIMARLAAGRGADIICAAPGPGDIAELADVRLAVCQ